jgi:p-aminobenzoyl-glutamate transporter AbgT
MTNNLFGAYIVIGILIAVILFVVFAIIKPKLQKYRFEIKKIEPKKQHRAKPTKKKRKSVWIRVI